MTTRQYLRLLGEKDARAGKSINAFFDAPLAGHHRHNENARAEYEMGYRAAKQEMRRQMRENPAGMKIYCAACGKQIDFAAAWRDSLSQTKICDKQCLEKIQNDYSRMILRREGNHDAP